MSPYPSGAATALEAVDFAALASIRDSDCRPAFAALYRQAIAARERRPALRPARPADAALGAVFAQAIAGGLAPTGEAARDFFTTHFVPHRVSDEAFFTGYYEPVIDGAGERSEAFAAPLLARPDDLVTFAADDKRPPGLEHLAAARRAPDGALGPYPDRTAIEEVGTAGGFLPVVWLRDWVEVFLVQVQGSARVRLPDGRALRVTYAGRNGHPYTSIGRLLVESGAIAPEVMSLDMLKAWLRRNGQQPGEAGRTLMRRNASYVFFDAAPDDGIAGPIGGAGVPLTPLVSIAVDRTCWCYGLPFWIDAALPWRADAPEPLRCLALAEDTGSAILGPGRVDLFLGSGAAAGQLAGGIRHRGALSVLLPRAAAGWLP